MVSSNNRCTILTGDSSRNFVKNVILHEAVNMQAEQLSIDISYTSQGLCASIPDLEIVMPEIIENKSINEFATAPMNTEPFCSNLDDNKLAYNKLPSIEKDVSEFSHYGHDINNRYILGEVSRLVFKAA
jgi:hypothetical protein